MIDDDDDDDAAAAAADDDDADDADATRIYTYMYPNLYRKKWSS